MNLYNVSIFFLTFLISTIVHSEKLNTSAPDFTLKSANGENIRLAEKRGEVVMLNFWASWCGPCRQEIPHLNQLKSRYEQMGFTLLGINMDEDNKEARKAMQKFKVEFSVLFDKTNEVAEKFNVDAMPTTVIIDRDGTIRYLHKGYKSGYEKDYDKQVAALVKE